MKKLAVLLCSIVLAAATVLGLAACGPKEWDGKYSENGTVVNAKNPKNFTASRTDDRPMAYVAYKKDGTKLGEYRALANAVNAAVYSGTESYVTRKGDTRQIFFNRAGYAEDSDECFWYYENGVTLDSFWCYDATDTLGSLKGSNFTTMHTMNKGKDPTQTYYSYDVLDKTGASSKTLDANYYQLSTTLDAAVMAFPEKEKGLIKATYEIDLSNVKITPSYTDGESSQPVYAFIGYYIWAPMYVLNVGIACDVKTGNWYPYIGTSRDNSASDTKYSLDKENCVMTSTWNDAGYFVPDCNGFTMTAETKRLIDEEGIPYLVDDLLFSFNDGTVYNRRITDGTVNTYFGGNPLNIMNMYVFVAGLDVISKVTASPRTENVDCFNGAKFENLTVNKAEGYVPTEEEMPRKNYPGIKDAHRGKTHNLLMASGGSDLFSIAILNNNFCSSYDGSAGKDVFSFSFDQSKEHSTTESPVLAKKAAAYQAQIDALKAVNSDNAIDKADSILDIEAMYGEDKDGTNSSIHAKYYNVLDFGAYTNAKAVLMEVTKLDAPAKKIADEFLKLKPLSKYEMAGWDGKDFATGQLKTDLTTVKKLAADFETLTDEMKFFMFFHIKKNAWTEWVDLAAEVDTIMNSLAFTSHAKDKLDTYRPTNDAAGDAYAATPENAMAQIAYWTFQIRNKGSWGSTDPTVLGKMNYDNSFQQSEFIVILREWLTKLEIGIPSYIEAMLDEMGYDLFAANYQALAATVQLGSAWQVAIFNSPRNIPEITDEQAELLTKYWNGKWEYTEGGMNWNLQNALGDMYARLANTTRFWLADGSGYTKFDQCFNTVKEVLIAHGYVADEKVAYRVTAEAIGAKAAESRPNGFLSEEAYKFAEGWSKIGPFGYKAYDPKLMGDTLKVDVPALAAIWGELTDEVKAKVAALMAWEVETVDANLTEWTTLKTEYEALEANETFNAETKFDAVNTDGNALQGTAKQFYTWILYRSLNEIVLKGGVMNFNDTWENSVLIVQLVETFEAIKDGDKTLELPAAVKALLDRIGYKNFFEAYDSVYQTVQLAQAIKDGSLTELSQLSKEQIEVLNKYWTKGYEINSLLAWNWNNNKMDASYAKPRMDYLIKVAGGTLKNGETAYVLKDYFKVVEEFLVANGYEANENGWGVTAETIEAAAAQ